MASQRYRRNNISSIKANTGELISDHHQMAGIIHGKFREMMGEYKGIKMVFDLKKLLKLVQGLDELTKPFEKAEMDLVVKHMPSNKAPGQYGFNCLFVKKCCGIICQDFYNLAYDFHAGKVSLESLNSSL
jgi:hypothetical protein